MFKIKTSLGWVLCIFLFYACTPTQPSKTNVLTKTPAHAPKPAVKNHPKQTVFTKPDQITRNTREEEKPVSPVPKIEREEVSSAPVTSSATAQYRSPQYYKFITDSIQRVSAKPLYYKMADSLMKLMTAIPGTSSKNPAINASQWYTAVNFNLRKPNFVVLHHTAQASAEQTLFTFSITRTGVSAHYVVGRDGVIYQMLNDYMRAWHAGNSKWGNITDVNSCSLGIEIDNNGTEPFSDVQIDGLLKLLAYLKNEYGIPQANFIAHSDIAPTRKNDPSKYFPWKKLADAGYSYWYDSTSMQEPPADFNALLALRVIGYDISNQAAAIKAFKLHYIQNDSSAILTDWDKKVLYNLYSKF